MMLVSQQELHALMAAAARTMRPRWYVVRAETGEIICQSVFARPPASPGYVVVGVRS